MIANWYNNFQINQKLILIIHYLDILLVKWIIFQESFWF